MEAVSYIEQGKDRGVTDDDVDVVYDVLKYNRRKTEETQNMIEKLWTKRIADNRRIYNASKFRLASHQWNRDTNKLEMKVGITDYKDHCGTNLSPNVLDYIGKGETKVRLSMIKTGFVEIFKLFEFRFYQKTNLLLHHQ